MQKSEYRSENSLEHRAQNPEKPYFKKAKKASYCEIPKQKTRKHSRIEIHPRHPVVFVKEKRKKQKTAPKAEKEIKRRPKNRLFPEKKFPEAKKFIAPAQSDPEQKRMEQKDRLVTENVRRVDHRSSFLKNPAFRESPIG